MDNDFFTTFDKHYFGMKNPKSFEKREFWKNTNMLGFKMTENC